MIFMYQKTNAATLLIPFKYKFISHENYLTQNGWCRFQIWSSKQVQINDVTVSVLPDVMSWYIHHILQLTPPMESPPLIYLSAYFHSSNSLILWDVLIWNFTSFCNVLTGKIIRLLWCLNFTLRWHLCRITKKKIMLFFEQFKEASSFNFHTPLVYYKPGKVKISGYFWLVESN